jgi:UDP-N-acetylglucosamine 2-epimerase (non-hydrolysing)
LKIALILGTRPEIIKMSPIIRECILRKLDFFIVHSGQHYSYRLDRVFFDQLKLPDPNYLLEVGSASLPSEQTGKIVTTCGKVLSKERPDVALVQGDTNTTLGAALSAVKNKIKVGHIEAGLRSFDKNMPEEFNRIIVDHCSDYLFAPTEGSKNLLLKEGIEANSVFVTGNTIVDAVFKNIVLAKSNKSSILQRLRLRHKEYVLVTIHRQENVDSKTRFQYILRGLEMINKHMNLTVVYPIHPRSKKNIHAFSIKVPASVHIIEPLDYLSFLNLLSGARLVITDSGGIQEEACIVGTACVTVRDSTERPETVEVGSNVVSGVKPYKVLSAAKTMLEINTRWRNPFGDGHAAKKIIDALLQRKTPKCAL